MPFLGRCIPGQKRKNGNGPSTEGGLNALILTLSQLPQDGAQIDPTAMDGTMTPTHPGNGVFRLSGASIQPN
jgi:hypothetical protein